MPSATAAKPKLKLQMELFSEAKGHWAAPYRQVFCQHDKDTVVLFRACCEHLGPHATATQCFRGSPCYEKDRTRMMWFDTSFLVSMRKSEWGTKKGREVVLAIWVKRSFIEDCFGMAVCSNTFGPSCGGSCGGGGGGGVGNGGSGRKGSGGIGRHSSFAVTPFPTSDSGGDDGRSPPTSGFPTPANSVAGSPPASPVSGQQHQRRQQEASASESEGGRASGGPGGCDDARRAAAAATTATALLAKGQASLAQGNEKDEDDGDNIPRGRAVTGDPSTGYYFGGSADDPLEERMREGGSGGGGFNEGAGVGRCGRAPERRARSQSLTSPGYSGRMTDGVRLHWEPERLPSGEKHRTRRVVQLGLKGKWLERLGSGDAVVRVERLDDLLIEQRTALTSSEPHLLRVPVARPLDMGHLQETQLAALHLVSERARPKLRILCLHGYLQNSQIFSQRTRQLCKKLKNTAELVYVDAPHLLSPEELPPPLPPNPSSPLQAAASKFTAAAAAAAAKVVNTGEGGALGVGKEQLTPASSPTFSPPASPACGSKTESDSGGGGGSEGNAGTPGQQQQHLDRVGARTWWRCDPAERKRAKAVPGMAGRCEWKGLEDSLAFLRQVWDEQGPFDGLLGFSQGAAMASIFNHCAFSGRESCSTGGGSGNGDLAAYETPLLPPPRFGVFISGCYQPHPTQILSYPLTQDQPQETLPSMHVWAVEDRFVPASQSQRLAGMYRRSAVFMHRGRHCVPQNKDIVPNFVRFLEERR
ncbi:unnamed protein product [Ectocarpus sp. 12 AP-2014]